MQFRRVCLLPLANEVWGKVIFLHLSVVLFTWGSTWAGTPLGRYTLRAGTLPSDRYPLAVHAGMRSTSGRYASHWNAFLFTLDSTQEIYVQSDSQETNLQIDTHILV